MRTLWATGQLELCRKEIEKYRCDILGIAEMRWTGLGEINGREVIRSGEKKEYSRGVGFLLSPRAKAALAGYKPVNSRIMAARFKGKPLNISVVQVYAPTADCPEEEINDFYEKLEETITELPRKDNKIITGD